MLGQTLAGVPFTSALRATQTLGTLSFSSVPCENATQHCTASSLRQGSNHCRSPTPRTIPRQGFVQTVCSNTPHGSPLCPRFSSHSTLHSAQDTDSPTLYNEPSTVHSKVQFRQSQRGPVHDEPSSTRQTLTINVPARVPGANSNPASLH